MLLRRMTEHVKQQNWLAVFLDFLIVVLGVLLAIQLSNWNDIQEANQREEVILVQLHSDITDAIQDVREAKTNNDKLIESTRDLLRIIQSGERPKDDAAFLETVSNAGDLDYAARPTVLSEMIASGNLSLISSDSVRGSLFKLHEAFEEHQYAGQVVLDRASANDGFFHRTIIMNPEAGKPGEPVYVDYDWETVPQMREKMQLLFIGKAVLSGQMEGLIGLCEKTIREIEAAQLGLRNR